MTRLQMSCLCQATRQDLQPRLPGSELTLCHCNTCRHTTGVLSTSYYPIHEPVDLSSVQSYPPTAHSTLFFCKTCGCHVFRRLSAGAGNGDTESNEVAYLWEVATGTITNFDEDGDEGPTSLHIGRHAGVEDTLDGGLTKWITVGTDLGVTDQTLKSPSSGMEELSLHGGGEPVFIGEAQAPKTSTEVLSASCHCGNVHFRISRPDSKVSRDPVSNFPDLMVAYASKDPITPNPDDVKWWLRSNDTKYLAGTCTCKSCRLISGFEIQTWAFIPQGNICFVIGQQQSVPTSKFTSTEIPLDFGELHRLGIIQDYESSPGVIREFCACCGATVFWHDKWRPKLIDVSVGLLRAPEGSRAGKWLDWWTGRVSFEEDATLDRTGLISGFARSLVSNLSSGLKKG
jgi:hypothetical protein